MPSKATLLERALMILAASFLGCATPRAGGDLVLQPLGQVTAEPRAVPGATYEVRVSPDAELNGELRVQPDGTSFFPLCGKVELLGLTTREMEARLAQCLAAWVRKPQVSVRVLQTAQWVWIVGDLSGRASWPEAGTLINLLALSGEGIANELDLVTVKRGQLSATVSLQAIAAGKAANVALEPGDVVSVRCRSGLGCGGRKMRPVETPVAPSKATATVMMSVSAPTLEDLTGLVARALPSAGLEPGEVELDARDGRTSVRVTSATAGEAQARCTALVMAVREALPAGADPARDWVRNQLQSTRKALGELNHSLDTLSPAAPCSNEPSVADLVSCATARAAWLKSLRPPTLRKDCPGGALCELARRWQESALRVKELELRYGPAHPTLVAATEEQTGLNAWFDRQRTVDETAMTSLLSRIPATKTKTPNAQRIRLESLLQRLESPAFDLAAGVAEDFPLALRSAGLEYGTVALERAALLTRFLEQHPRVVVLDARLSAMNESARKEVLPFEVLRLRTVLMAAVPDDLREDKRIRGTVRKREELLHQLQLFDALSTPPALIVHAPCAP